MLRLPARAKKHNSPQEVGLPVLNMPVGVPQGPAVNAGDLGTDQTGHVPPFLSLRESADWLCVSISTLKRLIANRELATLRVGARQKIPASTLAAYVARDILLPSQVVDTVGSEQD
jgi:excisionase family DNA binding protein